MDKPRTLRFTPGAWAKVIHMMGMSDNEVSGFGISDPEDLTRIIDFMLVKQEVSHAGVDPDEVGIAEYLDRQVELGRQPRECMRVWVHTHPAGIGTPSTTDWDTFREVFGRCDWSVMVVVPRGGATKGYLQYGGDFGGQIELPVTVNWYDSFEASDHDAWTKEYEDLVTEYVAPVKVVRTTKAGKQIVGIHSVWSKGRVESCDTADVQWRCMKCDDWDHCDATELLVMSVDSTKATKGALAVGTGQVSDEEGWYCPCCYYWELDKFDICPECRTPIIAKDAKDVTDEEIYAGMKAFWQREEAEAAKGGGK